MIGISAYLTRYAMEMAPVTLYGSMVIGASGAVAGISGGGIKSITKLTDAGAYEIELDTASARFLNFEWGFVTTATNGSGVAMVEINEIPSTFQSVLKSSKKFKVQMRDIAGAKVNAAAGSGFIFLLEVRRGLIGTWDK